MARSAKEKAEIGLSVPVGSSGDNYESSEDNSFINEWWAQYQARLRIQDRAHTLGGLLSSLILRIALAIITRIHSETAIWFASIFFSHV